MAATSAKTRTRMKPVSFDAVREIGLTLPAVEVSTYYGTPALKLGGQMLACMADHDVGYPSVLVRLRQVRPEALRDLVLVAWRTVSRREARPQKRKPSR